MSDKPRKPSAKPKKSPVADEPTPPSPKQTDSTELSEMSLPAKDPMLMFNAWFQALRQSGEHRFEEEYAMSVATATKDGRPSARRIMMKGYNATGFIFYTNYESRKGMELAENPYAALDFYWPRFHNRSVRVEGRVSRVSAHESDEYWGQRPQAVRIGAFISAQSTVVPSREFLVKAAQEVAAKYGEEIPRPTTWGGYKLDPDRIEFWQGRDDRLFDRIRFRKRDGGEVVNTKTTAKLGDNGWVYERLSP